MAAADKITEWLKHTYGEDVKAAGSLRKIMADMGLTNVSTKTVKFGRDAWKAEILERRASQTKKEYEAFMASQDTVSQALWPIIRPIVEKAIADQKALDQHLIDQAKQDLAEALDAQEKIQEELDAAMALLNEMN